MERNDQLKELIKTGQTDQVIEMIQGARGYEEGENFVFAVLGEEKSTPELVEVVLETFLKTRRNRYEEHGYWVHSLSHFTKILWERRMDEWIKKFNEVAFKGAQELGNFNCCDRLVNDFGKYATKWDDDPADFHLTPENLCRIKISWEYFMEAKARIEAGRFKSEEDFLCWKLRQPLKTHMVHNEEVRMHLVNINEIRSIIWRLQEFGADTSEFNDLERKLLTEYLAKLEETLVHFKERKDERNCKFYMGGIQKTREALAALDE